MTTLQEHVAAARHEGVRLVCGGARPDAEGLRDGFGASGIVRKDGLECLREDTGHETVSVEPAGQTRDPFRLG